MFFCLVKYGFCFGIGIQSMPIGIDYDVWFVKLGAVTFIFNCI